LEYGAPTFRLITFDLLELNGDDLRREPIEVRKAELARLVATAGLRAG
jgi:ATP-dependent DNA ligase